MSLTNFHEFFYAASMSFGSRIIQPERRDNLLAALVAVFVYLSISHGSLPSHRWIHPFLSMILQKRHSTWQSERRNKGRERAVAITGRDDHWVRTWSPSLCFDIHTRSFSLLSSSCLLIFSVGLSSPSCAVSCPPFFSLPLSFPMH